MLTVQSSLGWLWAGFRQRSCAVKSAQHCTQPGHSNWCVQLRATWWGWKSPPSAMQWPVSLLGASSGSLTHTKGTQLLLGWNVVALLKSALRSFKCMMFTCPGSWAGHNAQELHFVTHCGCVLAYLPARLPLSTAPDCARKTWLTCKSVLRAYDRKVRRKWLRGPDELTCFVRGKGQERPDEA